MYQEVGEMEVVKEMELYRQVTPMDVEADAMEVLITSQIWFEVLSIAWEEEAPSSMVGVTWA